jgi:hypothetical protein
MLALPANASPVGKNMDNANVEHLVKAGTPTIRSKPEMPPVQVFDAARRASIRPGSLNCERAPIAAIDVVAREPRFADNYRGKPFTIFRDRAWYG